MAHPNDALDTTPIPKDRTIQAVVPLDVVVLLTKLITKRTQEGTPLSRATKAAIVTEAIRALAKVEGVE